MQELHKLDLPPKKVRKVFKYATGAVIPDGAIYLCTKTETASTKNEDTTLTSNVLVWHYFLVEAEEER